MTARESALQGEGMRRAVCATLYYDRDQDSPDPATDATGAWVGTLGYSRHPDISPNYPHPQEFLTGDLCALPGYGKTNDVHVIFGVPGSATGRAATVALQSPDLNGRLWDFGNPIINWLFEGSAQGLEANPNGPGTVPIVPNISTTLAVLPGWIEADPEGGPAPPYHFRFALAAIWAR